ncbi:MAG TPA: nucleotidyltransferase family protein, partial [Pyrinomonadaceae bacterium]|nr:nucleotidyltransferase family protein [Pyrinomonadaceae bacterium]
RPYGDIDLWVQPKDLQKLCDVLTARNDRVYCVEPHVAFYSQYERSFEEVMRKSQQVSLNHVQVRVPADEDHLRFICLHFLFHGGWRPLWLCDVALMVESAGTAFDWDRCLRGTRKYADWIACTIGLAHQLLGANVTGTPVEKRAKALPKWLTTAVLRQWETGTGMSLFADRFSLSRRLLNPTALAGALREHWRNPIQASVEMNAWFNESPRSLLQLGSAFLRIPEFTRFFGQEIRRT